MNNNNIFNQKRISFNLIGTKIHLSFIGYRDFNNKGDKRDCEIINFSEKNFIPSVKNFECYGEGIIMGTLQGSYVILVCDAPCLGTKYYNIYLYNFSTGDPDG